MERGSGQAAKPPQRRQSPSANAATPSTSAEAILQERSSSSTATSTGNTNSSSNTLAPNVRDSPEGAVRRKRSSKSASPVSNKPTAEQPLQKLRKDIDHLRDLVTCNICYDLLFEPYTTSCGHTYCYGCLCHTFAQSKHAQCPQCRTRLTHAPAPAYLVRDMTHYFLKSPDLLGSGDIVIELQDRQAKAAQDIVQDKANKDRKKGGLFKGKFGKSHLKLRPIIDAEDGVSRCPYCQWELEDGMCNHCHLPFDAGGAGDWSSQWTASSLTSELDGRPEDGAAHGSDGSDPYNSSEGSSSPWEAGDSQHYLQYQPNESEWYDGESDFSRADHHAMSESDRPPFRGRASHSAANGRRRSYASSILSDQRSSDMGTVEEEDETGDSEMQDFIDDAEDAASEASSSVESEDSQGPTVNQLDVSSRVANGVSMHGFQSAPRPIVPTVLGRRRRRAWSSEEPTPEPVSGPGNQERDEEDDEGPIAPSQRRRNQRTVTTDDDEDNGPVGAWQRRHNLRQSHDSSMRSAPISASLRATPAESLSPVATGQSSVTGYSFRQGSESIGESENGNGVHLGFSSLDEDDDVAEDGDSDATIDGLAHNPNSQIRLSNERSLTTSLDRTRTTSRSTLRPPPPLGMTTTASGNGPLRRRTSDLSRAPIGAHHESDADDEHGLPTEDTATISPVVHRRPSVIHIGRMHPPNRPNAPAPQRATGSQIDSSDSDSDASRSPDLRNSQQRLRQPLHRTSIASLFNAHAHRQDVDTLSEIYTYAPELRGLSWTPLSRPRTANRHRLHNQPSASRLSTIESVNELDDTRSSERMRSTPAAPLSRISTRTPILSPRRSNLNPTSSGNTTVRNSTTQFQTPANSDVDMTNVNRPLQPSTITHIQRTSFAGLEGHASRSSLNSQQNSRPHVVGGSSTYPLQSSSVGINAGYRGQSMNPFRPTSFIQAINPYFNATMEADRRTHQIAQPTTSSYTGMHARPSAQRIRGQSSTATLQGRSSSNRVRAASAEAEATVVPITSRQPQVQPSRINLRSQPSTRALLRQTSSQDTSSTTASPPRNRITPASPALGNIRNNVNMTAIQNDGQRERRRATQEQSAQISTLIENRQRALQSQPRTSAAVTRPAPASNGNRNPASEFGHLVADLQIRGEPARVLTRPFLQSASRATASNGEVLTSERQTSGSASAGLGTIRTQRHEQIQPSDGNRSFVNHQARSTTTPAAVRA